MSVRWGSETGLQSLKINLFLHEGALIGRARVWGKEGYKPKHDCTSSFWEAHRGCLMCSLIQRPNWGAHTTNTGCQMCTLGNLNESSMRLAVYHDNIIRNAFKGYTQFNSTQIRSSEWVSGRSGKLWVIQIAEMSWRAQVD